VSRLLAAATLYAVVPDRVAAVEREWTYRGRRVCDGHDPEGNVFQAAEPA